MASVPLNAEPAAWERDCLARIHPPVAILGMGNPDRGDDGVGVLIAEELKAAGVRRVLACGAVPENFLGRAVRLAATEALLVDAADLREAPGAVRLVAADALAAQTVSTHSAGLATIVDFLQRGYGMRCWLLAIQPAELGSGRGLSPAVREAARAICASPVWQRLTA
jgi:hydrogenase maturation protease